MTNEWQPIKTAPKEDGCWILACDVTRRLCRVVCWAWDEEDEPFWWDYETPACKFTHWQAIELPKVE